MLRKEAAHRVVLTTALRSHPWLAAAKEAADRARKPVTIPSPGVCPTCGRANPKATVQA